MLTKRRTRRLSRSELVKKIVELAELPDGKASFDSLGYFSRDQLLELLLYIEQQEQRNEALVRKLQEMKGEDTNGSEG